MEYVYLETMNKKQEQVRCNANKKEIMQINYNEKSEEGKNQ